MIPLAHENQKQSDLSYLGNLSNILYVYINEIGGTSLYLELG